MVLNCCVFFVSSVLLLSLLFCVGVGAISFSFLMFLLCFVVVFLFLLFCCCRCCFVWMSVLFLSRFWCSYCVLCVTCFCFFCVVVVVIIVVLCGCRCYFFLVSDVLIVFCCCDVFLLLLCCCRCDYCCFVWMSVLFLSRFWCSYCVVVVVIIGVLYGFHLRFPFFGGGGAWIGCGRRVVLFSVMGLFLYSR